MLRFVIRQIKGHTSELIQDFMIGQVRNLSLKLKGKGFVNSVSLTSIPTMELLTLMYLLITSDRPRMY